MLIQLSRDMLLFVYDILNNDHNNYPLSSDVET